MQTSLSDVLIHIDENLSAEGRAEVEDRLREIEGVVSVHNPHEKPHLTIVQYVPNKTDAQALLREVQAQGCRAELVGL
jgi:hypothetical protein